jgi:hypothetical protein
MRLIIRRFLLAIALVAAATLLIPAPAQAGGNLMKVCFPVGTTPWGTTIWDCYYIEVPELGPRDPWPPECLSCLPMFDFWKDVIDPEVEQKFHDYLGKGFSTLAESRLTKDPKLAEQLRLEATELLFTAAAVIEKYPIELYGAGWYDEKTGKVYEDPEPQPLLWAIGEDLTAGTALMQAALGDPQPEPNIDAAMARFDEAYQVFEKLAAS